MLTKTVAALETQAVLNKIVAALEAAPGDMVFYRGKAFRDWRGQLLIAGLASKGLVRVTIDGTKVTEAGRYPLDKRIRDVAEAADGTLLVIEDGKDGRLLKLAPAK